VGPKGSKQFQRISWDEAIEIIAKRWKSIIATDGAQAILPYSYLGTQGIINGLNVGDPLFNKLGATVSERTFCDSGSCTAYMMTIGPTPGVDPESFVHSKYILLWACNTLGTNSHHWPFIEQARKAGAKLVVIDPVRTRTARLADWHIPIRPGTDAALALAMIHVIIKENLVDRDYIDKHTVGYDELAERASTYTPEFAAQETGIPVEDIVKLSREYATTPPAVVRIGVAVERHAGGGQTVRAIACLPGLIGAWKHVGGGLLQLPIWAFPVKWEVLMRPDLQPEKMRVLNSWRLGQALTGELGFDPPIKALFVYNANPMAMVTEQAKLEQGLEREDLFTVVSEHFLTDTARYADIVLPATMFLEHDDIYTASAHQYLQFAPKAIDPPEDCRSNHEVVSALALRLGAEHPGFAMTPRELIDQSLQKSGWGTLAAFEANRWIDCQPDFATAHYLDGFAYPDGKFRLQPDWPNVPFNRWHRNVPAGPMPTFPEHWAVIEEADTEYPFRLATSPARGFLNSTFTETPTSLKREQRPEVMIHPDDAATLAVGDGDAVVLGNRRGEVRLHAKLFEGVRRGVLIAESVHPNRNHIGGRGINTLTGSEVVAPVGGAAFHDNKVWVKKAAPAPT